MSAAMAQVAGRADGKRVQGARPRGARCVAQIELSNDVAAELAGTQDAVLRALEGHSTARSSCAATSLTLDGRRAAVDAAATVVARARRARSSSGHEIAPGTIAAVTRRLDQHALAGRDARGRRLAPPRQEGRAEDRQPEALRRLDPPATPITFGVGPAGTGKTFLAVALAAAALSPPRGQPHHPHPPRRRGRRAPRLPARRPHGEGRPLPAPALRRAARHARAREGLPVPRARPDRGRAAGLHARPHAERLLHHPRRGPEHHARADEDVPHAAGLQLADGRHRRHHADRPARATSARGSSSSRTSSRASRGSTSSASAARTSCATSSSSGSSRPTTSTPSARRPSCARQRVSARRSRSRSGSAPRADPREIERLSALALASAGIDGRPRRRRVRRRRADPGAQPRAPRQGRARPTSCRSRSTRRARRPGPRELGDVVICPEHTADLREAIVHGVLHLTGMDHETDDGEMLALQARDHGLAVTRMTARAASSRSPGRPERRQVDARQRDRRREGGDRLRQAADDAPRDPRRRHARRLAARARRPARRPAPARRADRSACSAASSASSATPTPRCCVLNAEQGVGPGDRFIAAPLAAAGARSSIAVNKVDRRDRAQVAADAAGRRRRSRWPRRSSRSRPARGAGVGALVDAPRRAAARGPVPLPARRALRPARARSCSPSSSASRSCGARARRCRTPSRSRSTRPTSARTTGPRPRARVGRDRVPEGHPDRRRAAG